MKFRRKAGNECRSKYHIKIQREIKALFEKWQASFKGILAFVHWCELVCVQLKPELK